MKGKNIIFSMLLIAATMFAGCEKDPAEKTQKAITVADSKSLTQEVFADELQGAEGVTVVTTGAWTSSISEKSAAAKSPQMRVTADAPAWISITPESGDKAGSYTISISLVPNTTGADRAAVITISCNGTDITISVTQKATKKDGTKPVTKRIVEFEVYACNAQWSPENNIPYIVAEGAHISVYKSSDDDPVEDYSTDENGRVAFEFEPGDYVYRVLWSNEGKRVQNVSRQGFVIAGIFTSQEEIDNSPMQSDAKPGNLKFADINGDGIINDNDKVYDELVSLHVDANENESKMQVKTYIAPYDFLIEEEIPYSLILQALEEEFTEMLRESYLIDAAITHQASLPQPYDVFGNFTFDANDNRILQLWRQSYKVISSANMLIEKTNDDVPVEDRVGAIYRAYAYSVLLNYFGGTPIIVTATPQGNELRNSEDEVRDFIRSDCDETYTMLPASSDSRYIAQQLKARILLGIKDFAGAANALQEIINSGQYSLQHETFTEGIDLNLPETMQKGTQSYPLRYTETLLMYAEAQTEQGNTGKAAEIVNQIAEAQGLPPALSPIATQEQCREIIHSFWTHILDREGHEFARLKRTGKFMETLGQYGAQSKHQLLPIPASELNLNPNMTQNPEW